jgi:signal transduction histidine kinase
VTAPFRQTLGLDDARDAARDAMLAEVARLELLRRLSMGAAHTLNNAFTGILGETLCLVDERKHDPVVAEACSLIQQEVERCARLTRGVAMRVQRRETLLDETNLASLLRGAEPLLRETVSKSVAIRCECPHGGPHARGASEDLELLLLLHAHRLTRAATRGGTLRVAVETADEHVDLVLELRPAEGATPRPVEAAVAGWQSLVDEALDAIAGRIGARIFDDGPSGLRIRLARS